MLSWMTNINITTYEIQREMRYVRKPCTRFSNVTLTAIYLLPIIGFGTRDLTRPVTFSEFSSQVTVFGYVFFCFKCLFDNRQFWCCSRNDSSSNIVNVSSRILKTRQKKFELINMIYCINYRATESNNY